MVLVSGHTCPSTTDQDPTILEYRSNSRLDSPERSSCHPFPRANTWGTILENTNQLKNLRPNKSLQPTN